MDSRQADTNELIVNCFDDFLKLLYDKTNFRFRNEQRDGFFMMTQIESIAFAVKYSEDLGAISIAFGKGQLKINETLRTCKTSLIKDFFKNIHGADYEYMRRILGYPELEKIAPEQKEIMHKSVEEAKQYNSQIRAFYDKNNVLYNCYKYGLRLMPALGEDKDDHMMLKFPSMKHGEFELEAFDKSEVDTAHAHALKIAGLIFTLLDGMFKNHRSWYFGREIRMPSYSSK
jgi:hypothetical protein